MTAFATSSLVPAGASNGRDRRHPTGAIAIRMAMLLLSLAAGCDALFYERNPGFCCEEPVRCKEWGAPGLIACENADEICNVELNRCVRAECLGDEECADPTQAFCVRGRCEGCVDSSSCAPLEGRPICDADGACRACRAEDCASGVCDAAVGACVPESDIAYVAKTGQDSGTCTQAAPCLSIGHGLDQLGERRWLHVAPSEEAYAEDDATPGAGVRINGKTVTIVGPGATLSTTRIGDVALVVEGAAAVAIEGLSIANAAGATGDGAVCRNIGLDAPTLMLRSLDVKNNGGRGISATTCTLTVDASTIANNVGGGVQSTSSTVSIERSMVTSNVGGGVSISGGSATITNNVIANNGSGSSTFGGVLMNQITSEVHFNFNTVAANVGTIGVVTGVSCNLVTVPLVLSNNIVYGNQVTGAGTQVGGNNCSFTYSDIGPQAAAGTGNINMDPLFVDAANANYHLRATSPAKDAAAPDATLGIDIDGDMRPQRGRSDMGADEVLE